MLNFPHAQRQGMKLLWCNKVYVKFCSLHSHSRISRWSRSLSLQCSICAALLSKRYRYLAFVIFERKRTLIHGFSELTEWRSFKSHSIVFLDITWITTHANRCPECERFYPLHSISHSLCILVSYSFIPLSSGKRIAFDNCY